MLSLPKELLIFMQVQYYTTNLTQLHHRLFIQELKSLCLAPKKKITILN